MPSMLWADGGNVSEGSLQGAMLVLSLEGIGRRRQGLGCGILMALGILGKDSPSGVEGWNPACSGLP